jgi:hypothetical protein
VPAQIYEAKLAELSLERSVPEHGSLPVLRSCVFCRGASHVDAEADDWRSGRAQRALARVAPVPGLDRARHAAGWRGEQVQLARTGRLGCCLALTGDLAGGNELHVLHPDPRLERRPGHVAAFVARVVDAHASSGDDDPLVGANKESGAMKPG